VEHPLDARHGALSVLGVPGLLDGETIVASNRLANGLSAKRDLGGGWSIEGATSG